MQLSNLLIMRKYIGIVKETNGNVLLIESNGHNVSLMPDANCSISDDKKSVKVRSQNDDVYWILKEFVTYTQILPAAPIPFDPNSQSIEDLFNILKADFFLN